MALGKLALLPIMVVALGTVGSVYALSITLNASNVFPIGGTGQVAVNCPVGSSCTISSVGWTISGSPYKATAVVIGWTTGTSTGTYSVYVTVYDVTGGTTLATGTATQAGSASAVSTTVTLSTSVAPNQVGKVEVDIVQTA